MKTLWIVAFAMGALGSAGAYSQDLPASIRPVEVIVMQHIPLNREEGPRENSSYLYFLESAPGVPNEGVSLDHGCSVYVTHYARKVFPAGRYQSPGIQVQRPSMWDRRWHADLMVYSRGNFDLRIHCKSRRRISISYMNRLLAGFIQVR
jgi:hypothetical protein